MPTFKKDKGEFDGSCNREACQAPGAEWYNHSTKKYYCGTCAQRINHMNPESYRLFGSALCTLGEHLEPVEQPAPPPLVVPPIMPPVVNQRRSYPARPKRQWWQT